MKKLLNWLLTITFIVTNMVPITGIVVHKLASVLFLLLCVVHCIVYRRKLGLKRYALLGCVVVSFFSGIFGMIMDEAPLVLQLHKGISIALVFFLAIHIFVFHKRMK